MITAEQRELRRKHIGSSDTAAIFGLDPWRNAADVYAEKVLGLDKPAGEAAELGNVLEPVLLSRFERECGDKLERDAFRVHSGGILCANHDALIVGVKEGVEAKTSGVIYPTPNPEAWGEAGTDEVPERVLIQCQHQMLVSELTRVWVPALIGGRGYIVYEVVRNEDLCGLILQRDTDFFVKHIAAKVPPSDQAPALELIKRMSREPNKIVQVPVHVVEEWRTAKEQVKQAEELKEQAEAMLRMYMQDAEAGDCQIGRVTRQVRSRKAYAVAASEFEVLMFKEVGKAKKKGVAA